MEKNKLSINDSSIAFVVGFIICQITVILASMLVIFFGSMFNITDVENFSSTCLGNMLLSCVMYGTMFLIYKFFTKNKNNKTISKPKVSKTFIYIGIAAATFFALYPIVNSFDFILTNLGFPKTEPTFKFNISNYFISLFAMAVLPAVCEELFFRGLIFKGLSSYGKKFAIIISSIMFSIYHMSLRQTIYPVLFGILLAIVMYKENNIFYTIIMHLTNNIIALTLMFLDIKLFINFWWYFVLAFILLAIYIVLLTLFIKKQKTKDIPQKIEKSNYIVLLSSIGIMLIFWLLSNIII